MLIRYQQSTPRIGSSTHIAATAVIAGRTVAADGLTLRGYAALRADGEAIHVGRDAFFAERATVHIAHALQPTTIGDRVTVGRYALVHACTLREGVVIGDGATVMDATVVGPYAVVAPGSLVPPRKELAGGFWYQGNPAKPVRELGRDEVARAARAIREGGHDLLASASELPPLDMKPFAGNAPAAGGRLEVLGHAPQVARAFVATNALLAGDVRIGDDASVYFGCALAAGGARIRLGERSNVQDNTLIVTDAARGDVVIGRNVTIGHNVRMGAASIGDGALIGMASMLGDGVAVEPGGCIAAGAHVLPGTVVKAGWIWAGRPARAFRELTAAERERFAAAADIYVEYGAAYQTR